MMSFKLALLTPLFVASCLAFGGNRKSTRRDVIHQTQTVVLSFMAPLVANFRHRTANGEGSDCERLAGGNEYIKSLQRRSIENKEANERESLNAYYMKNYPDVFAVDGKKMVKKTDGSFALYDTNDLARLTHEGRIVIEYPKSMGGRISGECRDLPDPKADYGSEGMKVSYSLTEGKSHPPCGRSMPSWSQCMTFLKAVMTLSAVVGNCT
ncbi:hypothetical protein THAOC_34382 [Thalassiosira oceanica]|uniref:Uncharacterized protein n=1 Tax=Thalassiosira oceanica TaxID=159749 RepID=K0RJQ8_THAOC|nr:hypothetical protein THAOC_34382 [Thalassiosira oceanica]|eukprot:EJK46927.1 hypothetical protein THAOC_34382 [Thalassiosira oceanica]